MVRSARDRKLPASNNGHCMEESRRISRGAVVPALGLFQGSRRDADAAIASKGLIATPSKRTALSPRITRNPPRPCVGQSPLSRNPNRYYGHTVCISTYGALRVRVPNNACTRRLILLRSPLPRFPVLRRLTFIINCYLNMTPNRCQYLKMILRASRVNFNALYSWCRVDLISIHSAISLGQAAGPTF